MNRQSGMPAISSQLLVPNIVALRGHVSAIRNAPSADEAYRTITEAHVSTLSAIENIAQIVESLESRGHSSRKPLSESKCVSNLRILSSDKSEFKSCNEKLINATSQSFGIAWRQFMKALNRKLDQDRKVLSEEDLDAVEGASEISDPLRCSEDCTMCLLRKQRATLPSE